MKSMGGVILAANPFLGREVDWCVEAIQRRTRPGDIVLDLSASPILSVLSDRNGPGRQDLVMPGTFRDSAEEQAFVDLLAGRPPALVVWPKVSFDLR